MTIQDEGYICVESIIPLVSVIPLTPFFFLAESLIYPLRFKSQRPQHQSWCCYQGPLVGSQLSKLLRPNAQGILLLSHDFFLIRHVTIVCLMCSSLIFIAFPLSMGPRLASPRLLSPHKESDHVIT